MNFELGCELGMITDLPVVYNLINSGEISEHAVRGLDVTTVKGMRFATLLLGDGSGYILAHPPGRVIWPIEART